MTMFKPSHPGEVLRELYLNPLGLTVTDTARALGVTRKAFSELINGHTGMSPQMALRLSKAFDTTPEIWLNMQSNYDLWKAKKRTRISKVRILFTSKKQSLVGSE